MNPKKLKEAQANRIALEAISKLFKKKSDKKKSLYLKRDAQSFDEQFYNPNTPSSRKKVKKSKPVIATSRGETLIIAYLNDRNITFKREKVFQDMVSPKTGQHLKMDFYLHHQLTCIEFDGVQHFKASKKFDTPTCTLQTRQANDRAKDFYCLTKGIDMIRIHYKDINKIAEILDERIKL